MAQGAAAGAPSAVHELNISQCNVIEHRCAEISPLAQGLAGLAPRRPRGPCSCGCVAAAARSAVRVRSAVRAGRSRASALA